MYYCNNCHTELPDDPNFYHRSADGYICDWCRRNMYEECENCGDVVHRDEITYGSDGNPYCEYCKSFLWEYDYSRVHGYHDRPENLQFLGNNHMGRYYGVELEIDNGEDMEYCAEDLAYVLDKRAWFNQDGSLEETGFEIITHPATINYHLQEFPWDAVCDIAKDYGYRSHNTDTCGLHVHVSRAGFGATYGEQELTIAKIILLVDRLWGDFVNFSRRDFYRLREWARKPDCEMVPGDSEMDIINKSKRVGRYNAVNLNNRNTVEFRLFRGTLKVDTIKATLQMLELLINFCRRTPLKQLFNCTFSDVMEKSYIYEELSNYLKERELI